MKMKHKRPIGILIIILILLLIPWVAMQYTEEVKWTILDFVVMGILLIATGSLFELIWRKVSRKANRNALYVILMMGFLLLWAELAVGIFGTPISGH